MATTNGGRFSEKPGLAEAGLEPRFRETIVEFAVYETFATAPDGAILHFEVFAPVTSLASVVERLIARHVGGADPEVETLRRGGRHFTVLIHDRVLMREIERRGIAIREIGFRQKRTAA